MDKLICELTHAIEKNYASSILLSGGLDSSAIATLAATELGKKPIAITVSLDETGSDLYWSERVTKHLELPWIPIKVSPDDVIENALPELTTMQRSFDLGILNDVPYYFAMRQASQPTFERERL